MSNKYAGTQTEKNLEAAFAGESQARNKYTFYASKRKKKGMYRLRRSLKKLPPTKRSTRSCGLNTR